LVSESEERSMGEKEYKNILQKTPPLASTDPKTERARRIGEKLAAVSGKPDFNWEFNVIDDEKTINAFCLPGGKVVVYTGILKIIKDDDELATVMGHEIGHAIAHHGAERMSQGMLTQIGGAVLAAAVGGQSPMAQRAYKEAYGTGANLGILLPFSRKHESEADYIGLILMSKAGFNPEAAVNFWQTMEKASPGKDDPLAKFMSTHPSHKDRVKNIKKWLPEARKYQPKE